MRDFSQARVKSYLGQNVNLHLKDGSVIVNVIVTSFQRNKNRKSENLHYIVPKKSSMKIDLRKIDWVEYLNPLTTAKPMEIFNRTSKEHLSSLNVAHF